MVATQSRAQLHVVPTTKVGGIFLVGGMVQFSEPAFPEWVDSPLDVVLQQYLQRDVLHVGTPEEWLHPAQVLGQTIKVEEVYLYLQHAKMLHQFLGMYQLQLIKKYGLKFFLAHFRGTVFGWRSAVRSKGGRCFVPVAVPGSEYYNEVVLSWRAFDMSIAPSEVSFLFAK